MHFPSVSKTSVLLTGTGAAGVGGVGVGAWQLVELTNSKESAPSFYPMSSDLGVTENISEMSFGIHGCFKNSFPSADVSQEVLVGEADGTNKVEVENPDVALKISTPSDKGESSGPVGCALMQMSHNLSKPSWALNAEITVKNDKVGWALWVSGYGLDKNNGSKYYQKLNYRLLLLKKEEERWNVAGGYGWEDDTIVGSDLKIKVVSPNGDIWIDEKNDGSAPKKSDQAYKTFNYSGVWESGEVENAKEVFQGMEVWSALDEDKSKIEILGREEMFKTDDERSYELIKVGYDGSKWVSYKKKDDSNFSWRGFDATSTLIDWYSPFSNRQGVWKELNSYCASKPVKTSEFCSLS